MVTSGPLIRYIPTGFDGKVTKAVVPIHPDWDISLDAPSRLDLPSIVRDHEAIPNGFVEWRLHRNPLYLNGLNGLAPVDTPSHQNRRAFRDVRAHSDSREGWITLIASAAVLHHCVDLVFTIISMAPVLDPGDKSS